MIYLRQSSQFQVEHHTGSTARQYALQDLAAAWGWSTDRIIVVDNDLGVSGSKIGVRMGFLQMISLITSSQVSAVFTVHVDRFARNLLEFAQLTTACEQFQVPWVVDGRVIELDQGSDRLLAMILGVFAEHENRDRVHKMRSSLLAKIREHKSALGMPPIGYDAPIAETAFARRRRSWGPQWVKSADPLVVQAVEEIFTQFRLTGTVGAVVRALRRTGQRIPCRRMDGLQYGTVEFHLPTSARVRQILRNPCYTDAFVFLRARLTTKSAVPGIPAHAVPMRRPPEEWEIVREHHEPYLSWEEFWANQDRMRASRSVRGSTPRQGAALLGRLLVCGHCNYRLHVHYGRHGQTVAIGGYRCPPSKSTGRWECLNVIASVVELPVLAEVLQTLHGVTAQAVEDALAQEQAARDQQRHLHAHELQQAEAAVTLAERRFKAVDPANTLVARQLEAEYEAALRQCAQLRYAQSQAAPPPDPQEGVTDVTSLLAIAADVQRVWAHPAVTNEERKELLRALLDRIVVRETTPGVMELTLHWHGGKVSTVQGYRKTGIKYHVVEYWQTGMTARDIAAALNAEGVRTVRGQPWSAKAVGNVLYLNARSTPRWQAVQVRIRELHGEGLQCQVIADRLNAEGLRVLTNELWQDNTVGIELQMLGLLKSRLRPEAGRLGVQGGTSTASEPERQLALFPPLLEAGE